MQGRTLETFLPASLSTATWAATYATNLPAVDIVGLVPTDEECNPPVTRVPRGRPKKERIRTEDARAPRGLTRQDMRADAPSREHLVHRCGTCGEPGHNAQTCRRPHQ
jgi:hypothetical protein